MPASRTLLLELEATCHAVKALKNVKNVVPISQLRGAKPLVVSGIVLNARWNLIRGKPNSVPTIAEAAKTANYDNLLESISKFVRPQAGEPLC